MSLFLYRHVGGPFLMSTLFLSICAIFDLVKQSLPVFVFKLKSFVQKKEKEKKDEFGLICKSPFHVTGAFVFLKIKRTGTVHINKYARV